MLELVGFFTSNIAILQLVVQNHKAWGLVIPCPQTAHKRVVTSRNVEFMNKYVSQRVATPNFSPRCLSWSALCFKSAIKSTHPPSHHYPFGGKFTDQNYVNQTTLLIYIQGSYNELKHKFCVGKVNYYFTHVVWNKHFLVAGKPNLH